MDHSSPLPPDHNSLGKGAFIVGLVGLVLAFVPIIGFVSWLLGPIAVLMGLIALRKPPRGLAVAGIVTGALTLLVCSWWISATKSVGEALSKDAFSPTGIESSAANAPIIDATIAGIWNEMDENKIAAGTKYGGHRLRFKDVPVDDFQGDAASPVMTFVAKRDGMMIYSVAASFMPEDGAKIGALKKGAKVSFVCDKASENLGGGYSLSGCKLI